MCSALYEAPHRITVGDRPDPSIVEPTVGDVLEIGLEVEDPAGVDPALEHVGKKVGDLMPREASSWTEAELPAAAPSR